MFAQKLTPEGSLELRTAHTVVCVDDEPAILSSVRRLVRKEPYELMTTTSAYMALDWVRERPVSLLIADQRMPDLKGTDLLRAVRACSPRTTGIILTGQTDVGTVVGAMNDGLLHYLIKKPWNDEEFKRMIRQILREIDLERQGLKPALKPPAPTPVRIPERILLHLDCRGRNGPQLLEELALRLKGVSENARPVLILEHLLDLEDSVTNLLEAIVRKILESELRASVVDESGCLNAFLDQYGQAVPLAVYASEGDLTPSRRILIVEDREENLNYLGELLESAGHSFEAARSTEEAIQKIDRERFDLVLLDLILPDAEGLDVARHLIETGRKTPVVAVSGYVDPGAGGSYARYGIRRVIAKPYRVRDIMDVLHFAS